MPQITVDSVCCRRNKFSNVSVITCDINSFEAGATFDRIFSIGMFEVTVILFYDMSTHQLKA